MCSGICTWMTSAPQSASWRQAVGPARTWVRSMTRKRCRAEEAGRCGISILERNQAAGALPVPAHAAGVMSGDEPLYTQHPQGFAQWLATRLQVHGERAFMDAFARSDYSTHSVRIRPV